MFRKKEIDMAKNNGNAPAGGMNSINSMAKGTVIEGSISTESDIRIDGFLKGDIDCKGKLIVGPSGVLEGNISCINGVIQGTVKGILNVKELLHVKETANINGEITTDKLIVDAEAIFNGKCQMNGQVLAAGFSKNKVEKVG